MGTSSSKRLESAGKRVRDEKHIDDTVQDKKSKVDSNQMKLLDINNDCLQAIFECLELEDLFNVAETHPRLTTAAQLVFSRRYRQKKIFVNLDTVRFIGDDCIEVRKDVSAIFFRNFGPVISHLFINFMGHCDLEIEQSLIDHCTRSLIDLELTLCDTSNMDKIDEPFEYLKQLTITKCSLGRNLSRLSIWFPSLTSLKLLDVTSSKPENLAAHFPCLKKLEIHNEKMTIPLATIVGILRANPKLQSLTLHCDYDAEFLRSISEYLRHLKELELWGPDDRFVSFGDQKIRFKNVEIFTLIAPYLRGEFVVNMPFVFEKLQKLTLNGFNEFKNQMPNFIKENPGLKELNLVPCLDDWDDLTCADLVSMVNLLPNLVDLVFCADTFTMEDTVQFLMENKKLQKVRALFIDIPAWSEFAAAIESKWTFNVYHAEEDLEHYFFQLDRKN